MALEDVLNDIDQEISDMNTAQKVAFEQGMGPGEFDLQQMTSMVKDARMVNEAKVQPTPEEEIVPQTFTPTPLPDEQMEQEAAAQGIETMEKQSRAEPQRYSTVMKGSVKIPFNLMGQSMELVEPSDKAFKQIKWDESGQVAKDSPVMPLGQDPHGKIFLAANKELGFEGYKYPRSGKRRVHYPQFMEGGDVLQSIIMKGADDPGVISQEVAGKIKELMSKGRK